MASRSVKEIRKKSSQATSSGAGKVSGSTLPKKGKKTEGKDCK